MFEVMSIRVFSQQNEAKRSGTRCHVAYIGVYIGESKCAFDVADNLQYVSLLDCQVAILENAVARHQAAGVVPTPLGNLTFLLCRDTAG